MLNTEIGGYKIHTILFKTKNAREYLRYDPYNGYSLVVDENGYLKNKQFFFPVSCLKKFSCECIAFDNETENSVDIRHGDTTICINKKYDTFIDVNRSRINFTEFGEFLKNIGERYLTQHVLAAHTIFPYFFCCSAQKNHVKIFNKSFHANYKDLAPVNMSISYSDYASVDEIREKLKKIQNRLNENLKQKQDTVSEILGIQISINGKIYQHAIALLGYNDVGQIHWFICDSNGSNASYYYGNEIKKLSEACESLGIIRSCCDNFFLQQSDTCKTCACLFSYFLSVYKKEHHGNIPLKGKDIDWEEIYTFLQDNNGSDDEELTFSNICYERFFLSRLKK